MIGVYKITNSITNEFYIGSSRNIQRRWKHHRCPSIWRRYTNSRLYNDMKKYGRDVFVLDIVEEVVDVAELKSREQYYIDLYQPSYNQIVANTGMSRKEYKKQYQKEYDKQYHHTEKWKQYQKEYWNRICEYNGERLTLCALRTRFSRMGIEHPSIEAKKYIIQETA